jgi:hypothetical protein
LIPAVTFYDVSECFLVSVFYLFFKILFILECIKINNFYVLKIIFDINMLKWFENIKKINFFNETQKQTIKKAKK